MDENGEKTPVIPIRVLLVDNDKDLVRAMNESLERTPSCCPEGQEFETCVEGMHVTWLMDS